MRPAELYRYIRDNTSSYEAVVPVGWWDQVSLEIEDEEMPTMGRRVSPRFFAVTGMRVARGRTFTESDGTDVVIVSQPLWRRLYGTRTSLDGAHLVTTDRSLTIIGVMPEGGEYAFQNLWLPLDPAVETSGLANVTPLVRLKPGVSREGADRELKRLAALLTDRFQARDAPFGFELTPMTQQPEELRDIQKAMVGAALLVLIIACANLAHLMLARGMAKRKELALRMAVGATRAAVVRQMFVECLLITAAGVVLGMVVALWGADFLRNRMPREVSWVGLVRPQLSWRVFALGAGAAIASSILFGLLPAIRIALGVDVNEPLKDDAGTSTGRHRHRYSALVVSEVGLALVLLMGAGLLLRTVVKLAAEKESFDTAGLYTAWVAPAWRQDTVTGRWRADTAQALRTRSALLDGARSSALVTDVAFASYRFLRGGAFTAEMTDSTRFIGAQDYAVVTPNYVSVLGLPILRGRNFEPGDADGQGVAIIDPIAAQALYRNLDPVGRMVKLGAPAADAPWVRIVGIMRSPTALQRNDRAPPGPTVLVAGRDIAVRGRLLVRLRSEDARAATQLQTRLREATGSRVGLTAYDYERRTELVSRWFLAKVFAAMGAVALALAAMGLYGVLAYAVSRRMREFAVRLALGAEPRQLMRMVLHDGSVMVLGGIGAGAFAALAASRYLDAVLISVLPSDVVALVLSEALLIGIGLAAALAPARRASRADPLEIIRAV